MPTSPLPHLLIVEDDQELARMVGQYLRNNGMETTTVHDGRAAFELLCDQAFDGVILDIGLPGMDGIEVCRRIRPRFAGPILILTARGEEIDEVVALEVGADDYMAKPVRPRALLARLKAHLRKSNATDEGSGGDGPLTVGELKIDPAVREVRLRGELVALTTAEFDLLHLLALHAGKVVPRAELYEKLNGIPFQGMDRSIDLRVSRLRRKLGDDSQQPQIIKSIRGVGYLLAVRP
ncbi:MAG: DNA-binding response regulator [Planctomycetota bacterium]|nr:MAG: DNA-binding response regulator [Planctomycetota bacterium]